MNSDPYQDPNPVVPASLVIRMTVDSISFARFRAGTRRGLRREDLVVTRQFYTSDFPRCTVLIPNFGGHPRVLLGNPPWNDRE
jgi:hypothetical protein